MTNLLAHDSGTVAEQPIDLTDFGVGIVTTFYNPLGVAGVELGAYGDGDTTSPSVINLYDADHIARLFLYGDGSIVGRDALSQNIFEVWSAASFATSVTTPRFISTVATGTAPLTVASTTKVTNLNADLLDGNDASAFEAAGTSAAHAALTAAHGATGAVVGTTNVQTLTNKTIVAASNTITTAASGNLTSTSLNAALAELQSDIDTRATTSSLTAATKGRVRVLRAMPPASSYATRDVRPGTSSPAESALVWDFDAATTEYMDFLCILENYSGGGLTFTLPWTATVATSGNCDWLIAIRRIADDAEDLDAAHTYDYNGNSFTTASASGELKYSTLPFTDGADMDGWSNGELAIVRVMRNAGAGSDTMAGDAELWALIGKET